MGFPWLLVPLGYFVGMFQSADVVGRFVGRNPRTLGSRNPGASNMYRIAGRKPGAIVLLLDTLKGMLPALAGLIIDGRELGMAAGAAAIIGHVFPLIRKLHGGKGVASFGGACLALWPIAGLVGLVSWNLIVFRTGKASVASLVGVGLTVAVAIALGARGWEIAWLFGLGGLIVLRHRGNVVRLLKGEEASMSS